MNRISKLIDANGWVIATVLLLTLNLSATADTLLKDDFSLGSGRTQGAPLDDKSVQTGLGIWQNEYNNTNEMNGFVFGTGGVLVPDTGKTSANNHVPYTFSGLGKIITVSAEFKAADSKTNNPVWTIGFWQTANKANLAETATNDAVTLRFFAGTNGYQGRLQLRTYSNSVYTTTSMSAGPNAFAATDVIRLSLSYDMTTGEGIATAFNVTANAPVTSAKLTVPGISDLYYAGLGITGLPANRPSPGSVDNFIVSADHARITAETLLSDNFSFGCGVRTGLVAGVKLDDTVIQQTGTNAWQNEYNTTGEMNEFFFGAGEVLVPGSGKTSANNYVKYDFSGLTKIVTASAEFKAAGNKTQTGSTWLVGLWETIDKADLKSVVTNDNLTLWFYPAGANEGRIQLRTYSNSVLASSPVSPGSNTFAATDVIRLSLSYDMITGEGRAAAFNVTSNAVLTSVKFTRPGISNLCYAGFGITGMLANPSTSSSVDNFMVSADHKTSQLVTDNKCQAGIEVINPSRAVDGFLQYTTKLGPPIWKLVQWNSQGTLYGTSPTLINGACTWSNQYKYVTLFTNNAPDSGVILAVNSVAEFNGHFRTNPDLNDWPHLLLGQCVGWSSGQFGENDPWLDQLSALEFHAEVKLLQAENNHTNDAYGVPFNPSRHCALFYSGITPQNMKAGSPDLGKLIAFGIFLYDDRSAFPTNTYYEMNTNTGAMVYQIGIPFTTNGLQLGQWKTIHGNILPYLSNAVACAKSHGCLAESTTLGDFKIATANIGWEVMGLSRVAVQVKNFGVKAIGLNFPLSYEFNTAGDKEGWSVINLPANGPSANGTWILTASSADPQLVGPSIRVDPDAFTKVYVRMANFGGAAANAAAYLHWKQTGMANFDGLHCQRVNNITNNGIWVEYTFDMANNTNWGGSASTEIKQLRLDPILNGDGHDIGIDYIRFD
ncbi:MAG: hypothetical protein WC701_08825 [Kiritimatiellales bacterium]